MATKKEESRELEWRVKIPHKPSAHEEHNIEPRVVALWHQLIDLLSLNMRSSSRFMKNAWKMGVDDPRKFIHCVKVGLALTFVSIFYYTRPLYQGVGGTTMWAIMTIVVIFEFTVGGTIYKGLNRVATLSAGIISFGIHWVADAVEDLAEAAFQSLEDAQRTNKNKSSNELAATSYRFKFQSLVQMNCLVLLPCVCMQSVPPYSFS